MILSDSDRIKNELNKVGIMIDDIYELVNSKKSYSNAIPALLNLLSVVTDDKLKEGIIRSLAVKEAKGIAGKELLKEFRKIEKNKLMLLWAIGNTMEVVISDNDINDVLNIVLDKKNGISRQMFVIALGRFKSQKIESTLIKLLDDNEVASHAIESLVSIKSQKAKDKITELVLHTNPLIRKEAKKALKKIK